MAETASETICYFKGEFIPLADAKVSVMTHAFNYGTGCFEGIRGYWNEEEEELYLFQLKPHYERLLRSCRTLMIDLKLTADDLCDITVELMRRNNARYDIYIRPLAFKDSMELGPRVNIASDALTIYTRPLGKYLGDQGLNACVSSWHRIEDNAAPARAKITGIYINSALARSEAELNGYDEAIMLSSDGHVAEGSAENLFIVDTDGTLVTPPPADNILVGITRNVVMTLARDAGLPIVERQIDRSELYSVRELFLCGTGAEISPVVSVDRRPIGDGTVGPITRQLQGAFDSAVRGKLAAHRDWCTPVYAGARAGAAAR
jgi:branched-chain amino acid aminotransferase